ncbi:YonK family protein [Bacillus infantis]|uniref:YonK family protein n=1 Tax=Bacillus infantis TaxID=324767 RepID=UPI003CEA7C5B
MAKKDFSISFSNCTISLEDNEIVEYPTKKNDEEIKTYTLSDIVAELQGKDRRFSISIKESVNLSPSVEG